jgi:hypothetical protein
MIYSFVGVGCSGLLEHLVAKLKNDFDEVSSPQIEVTFQDKELLKEGLLRI